MLNLRKYTLVSDQIEYNELEVIIRHLGDVVRNNVRGDVVEFGCYSGTTSLFIQRLLVSKSGVGRQFHVYDSFAGLPEKTPHDESPAGQQFVRGELAASRAQFIKHFKRAGLVLPIIHKAWFKDLSPEDIPEKIAFAFLDGDFYDSIRLSLQHIEHRLAPGATIIFDDYQSESLPGARRAVDDWLQNKDYALRIERSLAVIGT